MSRRVYLDHHAASPLSPSAQRVLTEEPLLGNTSSVHAEGRAAKASIEATRQRVACDLSVRPQDVVFTSGGTEACNLAVFAAAVGAEEALLNPIEHPATRVAMESLGLGVRLLPLDEQAAQEALDHLDGRTRVLVRQAANHETGQLLSPLRVPAGVRVVVDACQAWGKVDLAPWVEAGALLALSGAKIGGAAGAVVLPCGFEMAPRQVGGGQERGRRAGSHDVRAIRLLGAAVRDLPERLARMAEVARLRDLLERELLALGGVSNRPPVSLATVANVSFPAWRGATLVAAFDLEGVAVASGAACSSGLAEPSPVLLRSFPDEPWRAASAVRFSLGPETTEADLDYVVTVARRVLARRPA